MSMARALPKTAEWRAHRQESNSTATWHDLQGSKFAGFADVGEPILAAVTTNDPAPLIVSPTTILINVKLPGDVLLNTLADPWPGTTRLFTEIHGSTGTFVQPEYELLGAITNAPEDQRLECMRVLGLIEADEDGYVPRGPDPQTVDFELMALLDPDQGTS